ncbi:MAG: LPS export ABC transporter periplasmic protein LptC [Microcoleus sp. PH2017_29_MFU_D_A]|nr:MULTISPECIES: LPS export ABC transporter periplasmic protein LptC [unclassified Microcoleus]MCC3418027.1 LPS export ABC transporter periplasmic protein LptC [Microcoleus sp. PH2017_07_MST_O_A]MCC3422524.1 LPS export ABC transporter periplasmic protein LptC [Microcoleus sp. PH2017_01_SCD_O_A]MCC3430306.1 LPS export ABC transporter periplasmic protein LptC [Microcoleus sp. PH2017_04_SCI_O_A]MCC3444451.1 LPS export ABC transporter periplasmic protein LptC [Microcoleus sp. PH2017_03_ELD_O_A]MCC
MINLKSQITNFQSPKSMSLLLAAMILGINACAAPQETQKNKLAEDIKTAQQSNSTLTLNKVTLEQANEKGETFWKVKSKNAVYSKDQKIVNVQKPVGKLFQDGKEIYDIQGETGQVFQEGNQVFLKGNIVATDLKNGVVLRGNELEWRPKEDVLVVRNNLTGQNKQVTVSAKEARIFSRAKRMELFGSVVANVKDPILQLRTEHLVWFVEQQKVHSDQPTQLDRYKDKKVTDSGFADKVDVDLKTKIATLTQNAQLMPSDPPLQIESSLMSWNFPAQYVISPGHVKIFHRVEKVTMTGDTGRGDLDKKIFYLTGNVVGIGEKRESQLNTDRVTWYLSNQTFDAEGNVVYKQLNPVFNLTGPRAAGELKNQTVIVKGDGAGGQVVTEFVPDENKGILDSR